MAKRVGDIVRVVEDCTNQYNKHHKIFVGDIGLVQEKAKGSRAAWFVVFNPLHESRVMYDEELEVIGHAD